MASVGVVGARHSTMGGQGARTHCTWFKLQTSSSSHPPLSTSQEGAQKASREKILSNTSHLACDGHSEFLHGSEN